MLHLLNKVIKFLLFLTNPGKLSLAKGTATFASAFFATFASQKPKDPPDLIILDICALQKVYTC